MAFRHRSNAELHRAYWLFKLMSVPCLVPAGEKALKLSLSLHLPIRWALERTLFWQFCGGETIADCKPNLKLLADRKVGAILDYSVEGSETEAGLDEVAKEILSTIEYAANHPHVPFAVFKVTGLARFELLQKISEGVSLSPLEKDEESRALHRIKALCLNAEKKGVPILVDAEESWIQPVIDQWTEVMMLEHNREKAIVYQTLQMYRTDRLEYLKTLLEKFKGKTHLGLKIVRGAYMEKERARATEKGYPSPIYTTKDLTDSAYDAATQLCYQERSWVALCIGTHNLPSTEKIAHQILKDQLNPQQVPIYFGQLFGMSDPLSFNLSELGFKTAKYLPYGPIPRLVPYLVRRAQENSAISGQSLRELDWINMEICRRRKTP